MKHNLNKYLNDILDSIESIERYVAAVEKPSQIEDDPLLFDALCRRFSIVGEALYKANNIDRKLPITEKEKIIGLRHILVHDYDTIDVFQLWIIIKNKLNLLKQEIQSIITTLPENNNPNGNTKH